MGAVSFKNTDRPMKIEQQRWTKMSGWTPSTGSGVSAQLVLVFASRPVLQEPGLLQGIQKLYPDAHMLGCSTAGEICGTRVLEDTAIATAVSFENSQVKGASVRLREVPDSFQAGQFLAEAIPHAVPGQRPDEMEKLVHVLVLSDGLAVNGSDLVRGLTQHLPDMVTVTGGLAGDGERFEQTLTFLDGPPTPGTIVLLGFYGNRLKVGFGSLGGWDAFGPERLITRSRGNMLYELDGKSALGLYKLYLGEHAKELPAAGLLFPLSIRTLAEETAVVRTILSVDEKEQTMTFAGDIPEGAYARLMKANFDRLIDGATEAAKTSCQSTGSFRPELALLISCVGRKLVLRQRIEEEVEAVRDVLGEQTILAGFYSYGEIAPFISGARCELHNQTMTLTTFAEA